MGQLLLMGVPERPKVVDNRYSVDQLPAADPQRGIPMNQRQRTGQREHVKPQQLVAIGHSDIQPPKPVTPQLCQQVDTSSQFIQPPPIPNRGAISHRERHLI